MGIFVIHDADGVIIRTGNCPDGEEQNQVMAEGEHLLVDVVADPRDSINMETKEVQTFVEPLRAAAVSTPDYVQNRKKSYPQLSDQIDMLWHAMDEGEIPKATLWYDTIKAIKDENPKDGEGQALVYAVEPT